MPWTSPETFTAGQTLTAASMNVISENTRVLRALANVQQTTVTGTDGISNVVASFVDAAAGGNTLQVSITPTASDSKVLITATIFVGVSVAMAVNARLIRGASTIIAAGVTAGSRTVVSGSQYVEGGSNAGTLVIRFLDSPATTSATTYKVQLAPNVTGTVYLNRSGSDTDNSSHPRGISVITAQEIPA